LIFEISKNVSAVTEYISGATWCMLMPGHKLYGGKLALLADAVAKLKSGDIETVMSVNFPQIDLAAIPVILSAETAEELKKYMDETDGLSWAKGKCKSRLTLSEIIAGLNVKAEKGLTDFSEEIKILEEVIESETVVFKTIIQDETDGLIRIIESMKECGEKIDGLN